jgi:MFS family permease
MELFIHIPFTKRTSDKHIIATIIHDLKDGFYYVIKDNPIISRIVFLASIMNLVLTPVFIIGTPYILRVTMKSSDIQYGVGLGILELSTIIGALSTGIFAKKLSLSKLNILFIATALLLLLMSLTVTGVFLGFGYWLPFTLFFLFTAIIAIMLTVVSVFVITEIQKMTSNHILGKVMGIMMASSQIAAPLGQILYGILFQVLSKAVYVPVLLASGFTAIIALGVRGFLCNEDSKKTGNTEGRNS